MSDNQADYNLARAELRDAELALMRQREVVAGLRRELPLGPPASDYMFGASGGDVRFVDLFSDPARPLVLYHFMFGESMNQPCPMCSMWADGWNGVVRHVEQRVDFALVTQGTVDQNERLAAERGWTNLRWLSAAGTSFKRAYGSQDNEGNQQPFLTVFELHDGQPRLTYSGGAHIAGDHWRGVDLLSPVWHFFDLTRQGRGDFMPRLDYTP